MSSRRKLKLISLFLGDPVILMISALAAGIIVYSIASKTVTHISITYRPVPPELKLYTGFQERDLRFFLDGDISRNLVESFSLIGIITSIAGAYIVGFARDTGYSALSNLLGADRRSYLRAQILYPIATYITFTGLIAPIIVLILRDYNLLKYWKLVLGSILLTITIISSQLTIAITLTYILANTYRGLIASATTTILASMIGLNKILENLTRRETLNETLTAITAATIITITILTIAYTLIESRIPTR